MGGVRGLQEHECFCAGEVTGLFHRYLSEAGRAHLAAGGRERQGLIPDFVIKEGNRSAILDVNGINLNKSWYLDGQPAQATPLPGYAVKKRASKAPT